MDIQRRQCKACTVVAYDDSALKRIFAKDPSSPDGHKEICIWCEKLEEQKKGVVKPGNPGQISGYNHYVFPERWVLFDNKLKGRVESGFAPWMLSLHQRATIDALEEKRDIVWVSDREWVVRYPAERVSFQGKALKFEEFNRYYSGWKVLVIGEEKCAKKLDNLAGGVV